jgi:competence protein ComEA
MQRWLVVFAIIAIAALAIWHPTPPPALTATVSEPEAHPALRANARRPVGTADDGPALVYVVGAVTHPGLYRISGGARIDDAVRAAGGLRSDADPAGVNLAARTSDGDEIAVPTLGQLTRSARNTKRTSGRGSRSTKSGAIVDVNTATADVLASVPGLGATIAARIVQVREEEGVFATFDQLLDVAGMTDSRLARAQPYLRL